MSDDASPQFTTLALVLELLLLALVIILGHALERHHVKWIGEAGAALSLGLIIGLFLSVVGLGDGVSQRLTFNSNIFLLIMLPTIMFDAGYSMDPTPFVRNIGAICMFAFAGTTISTFVVGLFMWGMGVAGWCEQLSLLENLAFGAIISATDPVSEHKRKLSPAEPSPFPLTAASSCSPQLPYLLAPCCLHLVCCFPRAVSHAVPCLAVPTSVPVLPLCCNQVTVLAIFNKLGAQEDLYINVFGESVLNDAVAMVLFETIKGFKGMEVTVSSVFAGIGMFVGIFLGSVAMGIAIGLLAALLFRSRWLASREDGNAEVGIVLVVAFISFLGAQAAHLSGICSILFCGMVMRRYVRPNLSSTACTKIDSLFKTMAALFELFLFVYIGLTLFLVPEHYNIWAYTALVLIALGLSRAANILPCAAIVNHLRHPHLRMPAKHQFMMWWAGLRGAMAFALAVQASEDFGAAGEVMKTCTFYVIFITVLVNGGSCAHLIERLDLKAPTGPAVAADQPLITITTLTSPATNIHPDNGPDPSPGPGPAKPRPPSPPSFYPSPAGNGLDAAPDGAHPLPSPHSGQLGPAVGYPSTLAAPAAASTLSHGPAQATTQLAHVSMSALHTHSSATLIDHTSAAHAAQVTHHSHHTLPQALLNSASATDQQLSAAREVQESTQAQGTAGTIPPHPDPTSLLHSYGDDSDERPSPVGHTSPLLGSHNNSSNLPRGSTNMYSRASSSPTVLRPAASMGQEEQREAGVGQGSGGDAPGALTHQALERKTKVAKMLHSWREFNSDVIERQLTALDSHLQRHLLPSSSLSSSSPALPLASPQPALPPLT